MPADVAYTVGPEDLATVENAFHADVDRSYYEGRAFFRPYSNFAFVSLYPIAVPTVREDRITADDTRWGEIVDLGGETGFASMYEDVTTYEPGAELSQSWAESPSRPARASLLRTDDLLSIFIPPWTDQDDHVGYEAFSFEGESYDQMHLLLSADGRVLGEADSSFADFTVPVGLASYELTLDATRDVDWWLHSTSTSTTWWFTSQSSGEEWEKVKLPLIDYDVDLGLNNTTDAPNLITFSSANVRGAPEVAELTAAWSIDDGTTWQPLELSSDDHGSYDATVPVPTSCDPSCFVSLQVGASGADGPLLRQQVLRAYTAQYAAPPTSPPPTSPPPTTPPPTTPPPTTSPTSTGPSSTPTTTLPGTGAGNADRLAGLGLGLFLLGGLVVAVARRRLQQQD